MSNSLRKEIETGEKDGKRERGDERKREKNETLNINAQGKKEKEKNKKIIVGNLLYILFGMIPKKKSKMEK